MRLPDSPGAIAERVREDVRQCAALLSRARQYGEQSPEYQAALAAWSHRQAIIGVLAERLATQPKDVELHRVAAYDVISATRLVRTRLLDRSADNDEAGRRFLEATEFLAPVATASASAQGFPDWNPEPPTAAS
ncbi:hypothetical protein [Streptomyces sp. NPDC048191]|uniref:hypothetical protein n=1 Tax=Streptomyces sp. NPDC048191 TaxID=3155484 RepID=UPI0033D3301E